MVLRKLSQCFLIALFSLATIFNFGVNPSSAAADVVLNPAGGSFVVQANNEAGVTVLNPGPEPQASYYFIVSPNDTWQGGPATEVTTYCGYDKPGSYTYPEYPFASMVADCSRGIAYYVCANPVLPLLNGEECTFKMNDQRGAYGDNAGDISVEYGKID